MTGMINEFYLFLRHSREGGSPVQARSWVPAYAGITGIVFVVWRHDGLSFFGSLTC
jgi:hypothetical protein